MYDITGTLKQIWGYESFRPPQEAIVRCLLAQQDALILMATGAGKSICFQLPALLSPGVTIVVSPLVALMENQVQALQHRQLPAALLHSELPSLKRRQVLQQLIQGKLRLLYLSPETLLNQAIWQQLTQATLPITNLILDEAHCLSQWGETFRPSYYRLGAVRTALLKTKPAGSRLTIAAFTATADPEAQRLITQVLQLQRPQIFRQSPYRPNISLTVKVAWSPGDRRRQLLQFIRKHPNQSGLVYVRTRQDSQKLALWLQQQGFSTAAYHAGLGSQERRRLEQEWITGGLQFVVCTCAFGMGIDKSDCQWVIHHQTPLLLSEYVQEIGRGGRDGQPTYALSLISEPTGWLDPDDRQRQQYFVSQLRSQQQTALRLLPQLPRQGDITTISRQFKDAPLALAYLHGCGQLRWDDPFHYTITHTQAPSPQHRKHDPAEQMQKYLRTRGCRWQFILQAFGFSTEAQSFTCGHCDNCIHPLEGYKKSPG